MIANISSNDLWQSRKLGEMAEEVRDLFEPRGAEEYPYVGLEHIEQGTLQLNSVGQSTDTVSTKKQFKGGEILFGSLRPYFRKVVRPKFNGVCSTDITVIRPKKNCNAGFLQYFIANQSFIDHATNISSGTRMPRANWKTLCESEWQFPPLPTQQKIAAILSAYDDLIENNTRRIKILEAMAQAIYREWFVHFRFSGHEKAKMVSSPLGPIPKGWEVKPIGEVVETLGGGTPSTKNPEYWEGGGVIWFTPSDLTAAGAMFIGDSSKKITELGLRESSARLFPPYSVMMTSRATIGVTAINTKEACTNQGFIICIPNEHLSAYQLYFWIDEHKEQIITIASGATYKEISRSEFRELPTIVPPRAITSRFLESVGPIGKQIENLLLKNINLRQTRDLLLPKLISGELDVSELDINTGGDENDKASEASV